MNHEELLLPKSILDKAIRSGNEYGWRKDDILDVIESARQVSLATIGGQVQYILSLGTYELYWINYDATDRTSNEDWLTYCNRSAYECSEKFKQVISLDIDNEAIAAFPQLNDIEKLSDHQVFILYFKAD